MTRTAWVLLGMAVGVASAPASAQPLLPAPVNDPLANAEPGDSLLAFANATTPGPEFAAFVRDTVRRAPREAEATATVELAEAQRLTALSPLLPNAEATFGGYRTIDRFFGGSNATIIERSRPRRRTDYTFRIEQLVFDWLASPNRLRAASARLASSGKDREAERDRIALEAIAAWYDVFTYRALVALSDDLGASSLRIRGQLQERVRLGASSEGDLAQIDSELAANDSRRARFVRLAAQAEARFQALSGEAAPGPLARAPRLGPEAIGLGAVLVRAEDAPAVESARKVAQAARLESRAAKGEALPRVSVGVDGGRYGVFETEGDREIRGTFTVRVPFSAGTIGRIDEASARAGIAEARYDRVREEALRDATIAVSDLKALIEQESALRTAYISARRARDVVAERFRLRSGTLADVLRAEDNLVANAIAYLQAVSERDAAHYVLLSRTGLLLDAFDIPRAEPFG